MSALGLAKNPSAGTDTSSDGPLAAFRASVDALIRPHRTGRVANLAVVPTRLGLAVEG